MERCVICSQTEDWHKEHKPKHAFVRQGEAPRLAEEPPPKLPSVSMSGDPVLRLALVKAGVLTDLNILEAEVWVREAAQGGGAVVVEDGQFKLLTIEQWIAHQAAR